MNPAYAAWISEFVAGANNFVRGKCAEATALMVEAFPELRRTCGFVVTLWGEDQHWWCVAPDGTVIDPTAAQFPFVESYEEVDPAKPHRPIPMGICANCSGPVFDHRTICSDACFKSYVAYCSSGAF